jgi:2-amino-4-hydroxy-6-hydroxymethyldihydropteridine diphosphokinase
MPIAYLGLGANLGDARKTVQAAADSLRDHQAVRSLKLSSLYRSKPWGITEQPDFINAAAELHTELAPLELLALCLKLEERFGRQRREKWGPRELDLDLLLYDSLQLEQEQLVLPHPHLTERLFVLQPLVELAPQLVHPVNGRPLAQLLAELPRSPDDLKRL